MKKLMFILMLTFPSVLKAADLSTLQTAYDVFEKNYIVEQSIENLATKALKGFELMDNKVKLGVGKNTASIYYGGKLLKTVRLPNDKTDITQWIKTTDKIAEHLTKISASIKAYDFEISQNLLKQAFDGFDDYSTYYPNLYDMNAKKTTESFYAKKVNGVLYVKMTSFNNYSKNNLQNKISEEDNLAGLVLDLRKNSGGILAQAVEIADLFVDGGVIASTFSARNRQETYYNAKQGDILNGKPIVLIIDKETSSAAEMLALTLKEQARAKIIGQNSFGKNSVQDLWTFDDESALSLTCGKFFGPLGTNIDKKGVAPDIEYNINGDNIKEKAFEMIKHEIH